MRDYELEVPIEKSNDAIVKDDKKCISCGYCQKVCKNDITVAKMYEYNPQRRPICIGCGQCANICPTESIHERFHYFKVRNLLHHKNNKIIIFSIAPAVRVTIGEEFGYAPGTNLEGKIVSALRKIGADYVFDITFGADLTIMEEAMELVNRIKNKECLPQFTSCCPAWVKYCEIFYPELLPNLSTAKSPIAMQSTIVKTYFASKIKVSPKDIVHIVIAPCTAKKAEINRAELNYTAKDTDYVLTTRELAMLLKKENISFKTLRTSKFDSPLATGSTAGVIFGSSGGVCEAAIRTAYYFITNKNLSKKKLVFTKVRGMLGIKETSINVDTHEIKVAVCNGMKNAHELIEKLLNKEVYYDFIEVMNCQGGCIAGGGGPKMSLLEMNNIKQDRMNGLYTIDEEKELRLCHKNPEIISLYKEFLGTPNSKLATELLHTRYFDRSHLLRGNKNG